MSVEAVWPLAQGNKELLISAHQDPIYNPEKEDKVLFTAMDVVIMPAFTLCAQSLFAQDELAREKSLTACGDKES